MAGQTQKEIQAGEDARKNWLAINKLMARVTRLETLLNDTRKQLADLQLKKRAKGGDDGFWQ